MMGAMDTKNMYSKSAVNKYLHTVASCWILLTVCSSLLSKNIKTKIYRTISLPVVLYACETLSFTLREECRLSV